MPAATKREVSPEHKSAMAVGRTRGRAIGAYLEALESNRPQRGRRMTPDHYRNLIETTESTLSTLKPLQRVLAVQKIDDAKARLAALEKETTTDIEPLQDAFAQVAAEYSASKGITRATWRSVGVPAKVLDEAGIKQ